MLATSHDGVHNIDLELFDPDSEQRWEDREPDGEGHAAGQHDLPGAGPGEKLRFGNAERLAVFQSELGLETEDGRSLVEVFTTREQDLVTRYHLPGEGDFPIMALDEAGEILAVGPRRERSQKLSIDLVNTSEGTLIRRLEGNETQPIQLTFSPRNGKLTLATKTHFWVVDPKTGEILLRAGGADGPQMRRVNWDVGKWKGQKVFLRITDRHSGGWGHLCFDDFSVEGELVTK